MTEPPSNSVMQGSRAIATDSGAAAVVRAGEGDDSRRALLALLLLVPAPVIGVFLAMVALPGTVAGQVGFVLCKVWMLALPLTWHLLVDRQRLSLSPVRRGGLGAGALLGVALGGVMLLAWWLIGPALIDAEHVREVAVRNGIGTPLTFVAACLFWIVGNSLLEEYVYRWFVVRKAETLVGTRWAVVISAAAFTLHHIVALIVQFDWPITVLGTVGIFVAGAVWSWLYIRFRSIWPGYLSHVIVDIAMYVIGAIIIFG